MIDQQAQPVAQRGDWMQTYTGRQFWPLSPRAEDVDIEDIAHALSMLCRYGGHTRVFYSIAQHSCLVHDQCAPEDRLWGLLHDASEAYVADLIRPIKPSIVGYRDIEARVMAAIAERFGLSGTEPRIVKHIDTAMLHAEQALLGPAPVPWTIEVPPLRCPPVIMSWSPAVAKMEFLRRFEAAYQEAHDV